MNKFKNINIFEVVNNFFVKANSLFASSEIEIVRKIRTMKNTKDLLQLEYRIIHSFYAEE